MPASVPYECQSGTLAERRERRDRERFSGRAAELAALERLFVASPPASVVLLHGPGGIGKSTLLREVVRRARAARFEPVVVDGGRIGADPDAFERAVAPALAAARPLLVLDTWERLAAAGTYVREQLVPALPESALVLIAGRREPEPEWFRDGWETLAIGIELRPLPRRDAAALLAAHGVRDEPLAARVTAWAKGSPLALAVAADVAREDPRWSAHEPAERAQLMGELLRRVCRTELDGGNLDVAAVAAFARTTTPALLADVLPGVDAGAAESWLRGLSFARPAGGGVTLHELAREAIQGELAARSPERAADLRCRIADHLHARAGAGHRGMLVELAELLQTPAIRWGFGAEGSVEHRVDGLRPGDLDALEAEVLRHRPRDWWAMTRALLEQAPDRAVVARDRRERISGFTVAVVPADAPAAAQADPVLRRWLAHAREHAGGAQTLVWRDAQDLTAGPEGDPSSPVLSLLNTAAMLRSGLPNPRVLYLPISPANAAAVAFAAGIGAVHVPELDVEKAGRALQCHVYDAGPGGVIGAVRATVYAEAGRTPRAAVSRAIVLAALRNLHRPDAIAASPLARGDGPGARARSVRAALDRALDGAFGDSPPERALADVVRRGYFEPSGSHEDAADALFLSRSTYFRRLRQGSERLADWLAAHELP